jgi:hypothetical protein
MFNSMNTESDINLVTSNDKSDYCFDLFQNNDNIFLYEPALSEEMNVKYVGDSQYRIIDNKMFEYD